MTDTTKPPSEAPPKPPVPARTTGSAGADEPRGQVAGGAWRLALLGAAVVGLGVVAGRGWLFITAALFVMIFLHELGHYLTAKWTGMKVTEFFIGFGPKLWSFRRGETEYGLKAIPFAAYVRIIGMNNLDEVPPEDEPRTYRQQSYPRRLLVVSAGSLMHFLQAFVLFLVVFAVVGVPAGTTLAEDLGGEPLDERSWIVGTVVEGSAAEEAGIEVGDDIVAIDGVPVETFDEVGPLVNDRPGEHVELLVERDGREIALDATIGQRPEDPTSGFLGIGGGFPDLSPVTTSPVRAFTEATTTTGSFVGETVTNLASFFTGGLGDFMSDVVDGGSSDTPAMDAGSGSSSGEARPAEEGDENRLVSIYGVARIGASMTDEGFGEFLILLALVNISIGVLNLIPLLPLDGGHVAIATYERIRSIGGRRHMADVSRLLPLTYAVFMFLIMLGVSSIYLDVVDPIGVG